MAMTKKDYTLIAEVLKNNNAGKVLIKEMADELHKASKYTLNGNKSFNDDKFILACSK